MVAQAARMDVRRLEIMPERIHRQHNERMHPELRDQRAGHFHGADLLHLDDGADGNEQCLKTHHNGEQDADDSQLANTLAENAGVKIPKACAFHAFPTPSSKI